MILARNTSPYSMKVMPEQTRPHLRLMDFQDNQDAIISTKQNNIFLDMDDDEDNYQSKHNDGLFISSAFEKASANKEHDSSSPSFASQEFFSATNNNDLFLQQSLLLPPVERTTKTRTNPLSFWWSKVASISSSQKAFFAAVSIALSTLIQCYTRSFLQGDLFVNPDWSISRIIAYSYNTLPALGIVLPSFIAMIWFYARQHSDRINVQRGALWGVLAAPGIFMFDVLHHGSMHFLFVSFLCMAAWHWRLDLTPRQTTYSGIGFFLGLVGAAVHPFTHSFLFGAIHGIGELLILATWASMIFNHPRPTQSLLYHKRHTVLGM